MNLIRTEINGANRNSSWPRVAIADHDFAKPEPLTNFLTLWKGADPDIPILKEAKAEYAKLQ